MAGTFDEKKSEELAGRPSADVEKEATHRPENQATARILKHSNDADEALKAFQGSQGTVIELDEATNRRLLRKIDLNLMPVGAMQNPKEP